MNLNKMQVFSEEEVKNIVEATSRILAETGVKVDSEEVLKKLKEKGADVDMDTGVVRFSEELQKDCITKAPKRIDVVNRGGKKLYTLGVGGPVFASGHNAVFVDDRKTGKHRTFTVKDVDEYVAISHQLEYVDMIGLPSSPGGVPSKTSLLYALERAFLKSDKPVYFSTDSEVINHYAIEMTMAASKEAVEKGAYMISQLSPTSPLFWEKGAVEGVVECAERNFPLAILPEPISGVSAPYSLAGLITVHNAEAISGVCITQLINPGTPVIWASSWTTFDMRKSAALVGSIETTLCRIGGAQVAKYYDLPLHTTAPNSDNHAMDEQNCWEKTFSAFCGAAAGNDLIVNLGMYACGMTISLEQLVMDAEIIGQVKKLLRGIDGSPKMIAEELIKETSHRGDFIMSDHTLGLLKSGEHREPIVAARGNIDTWREEGGKDAVGMAKDKVEELLALDLPELDETAAKAVRREIEKCEEGL
jgi:trimethylamine---corrinoid protein Co-methyltransferase